MATIVYKSAELLVNGFSFQAALHELTMTYQAEILDASVFGLNTRKNAGGLTKSTMAGKGFVDSSVPIEGLIFNTIGGNASLASNPAYGSGVQAEDTIFLFFPDLVTEGGDPNSTAPGYAMKGVMEKFDIGGAVGVLLSVTFSAQTRGTEAI